MDLYKEKCKNERTYVGAFLLIKNLWLSGKIDKDMLIRLNAKCAQDMNCIPIELK